MSKTKFDMTALDLLGPLPVFNEKLKTVAGIKSLIKDANVAGYKINESWMWVTGHRTRFGVVELMDPNGEEIFFDRWDVGSTRMPSASFRVNSAHGHSLRKVLSFLRGYALEVKDYDDEI